MRLGGGARGILCRDGKDCASARSMKRGARVCMCVLQANKARGEG